MAHTFKHLVRSKLRGLMRQFGRDEDGSMIIFSLFMFMIMLILGGMAVDFMRFESRRAQLQGVADRAALAGANLNHDDDPKEVVIDYITKAGMAEFLNVDPIIQNDTNYRSVEVTTNMELSTFFLKLVGIDEMEASSTSTAVEGVGEVEISLVVDISGSMRNPTYDEDGNSTGFTKIEKLREAASAFVDSVLDPLYEDKISISLVPYSQQVNAGPTLFGRLNTIHQHDFSHCIEFPDSAFLTTAIDTATVFEQGQHVQFNSEYDDYGNRIPELSMPVCPNATFERITHITQDATALKTQIESLEPRAGTSIFFGLKWGLALLDDTMAPIVATGLDTAFTGRPVAFGTDTNPSSTSKVVVLMTDGENQWSNYLYSEYYDHPDEYAHWNDYNYPYHYYNQLSSSGVGYSSAYYTRYNTPNFPYGTNATDGDALTQSLCDAARDNGITIFAIAFEASEHGGDTMANCATTPSHYYQASGSELTEIFRAIANQITELRLTQ
jgi:Flp pilus assembly protein TadG